MKTAFRKYTALVWPRLTHSENAFWSIAHWTITCPSAPILQCTENGSSPLARGASISHTTLCHSQLHLFNLTISCVVKVVPLQGGTTSQLHNLRNFTTFHNFSQLHNFKT